MDKKPETTTSKSSNKTPRIIIALVCVLALAAIASTVYVLATRSNDDDNDDSDVVVVDNKDNEESSQQNDDANNESSESSKNEPSASQKTINAILTASKSKDYSALEPYFADRMFYGAARSSGGYDTPDSQVVNILNSMGERAQQPWSFDEDVDDIEKSDSYDEYINDDMYVGVDSAKVGEREVVSFKIDNQGKIRSIFVGNESTMTSTR